MDLNFNKRYAYSEVYTILNWLGDDYKRKVPQNLLQLFKLERKFGYEPDLDFSKPLTDQVRQETKDYEDNLRRFQPDYMVHGTDWRQGPLAEVRQKAIDILAEWGGSIVEPEYTQGVSSSQFKKAVKENAECKCCNDQK